MKKGGAEIIALTAATMHVVFDKLKPQVDKPFISIPEAAAEYAVSKGYKMEIHIQKVVNLVK